MLLGLSVVAMIAGVLLLGGSAHAAGQSPAGEKPALILDSYSLFRCHFEQNGLFVKREDGSWWPRKPVGGGAPRENWQAIDFDDSDWPTMPGPFFSTGRYSRYGFTFRTGIPQSLSMICLRGSFEVTDPAKIGKLKLTLSFRGGAVVYVNGKEIKRSHLPDGKLDGLTLAEPYPKETYVKPDGSIIRGGWQDPDKNKARVEKRIRHIRGLVVPQKILRKGKNVLVIELHSAPYHELTLTKTRRGGYKFYGFRGAPGHSHWLTIGLPGLSLTASGDGVLPALTRPEGFQVYAQSPLRVVYDTDYALAGAGPKPLRIIGARNGSFAAQLVVARDKAISDLRATVTELKTDDGKHTIPASALRLRYPQPTGAAPNGYLRLHGGDSRSTYVKVFDALSDVLPKEIPIRAKKTRGNRPISYGAVQPVWLTVDVPADAAAGVYTGALTVQADGLDATAVPVRVEVTSWTVPPPHLWRTHVGFFQSPESVSLHYGTEMWSDKHFEHLDKSLEALARAGDKTVYVTLIAKTDVGNSQTMLRWTKQADGSLKPDFSVVDRYLALVKKHYVKPPVVCFYVWDRPFGGGYFGKKAKKYKAPEVSVVDTKTGEASLRKIPAYDKAEARTFWKPAADGIAERLRKLGWMGSLMLGVGDDFIPSKTVVKLWRDLLPTARWVSMGHSTRGGIHGTKVGYCTVVWSASWAPGPSRGRRYGWQRRDLVCHYDRDSWRRGAQDQLLMLSHLAGERNITGSQRGFGRLSGDFWRVKGGQGRDGAISARYPDSSKGQLQIRANPYLWPGPDGARSTVRLEMLREGLIDCEARITVEVALLDKTMRAKLGEEKAKEFQALLDRKTNWTRRAGGAIGALQYVNSDWRGLRAKIFAAAAEVERIVGRPAAKR
jgi:glycosyl hydrolase family 123